LRFESQHEREETQSLLLPYTSIKETMPDTIKKRPIIESMYVSYTVDINYENVSGGLEPLIILHQVNQFADLQP